MGMFTRKQKPTAPAVAQDWPPDLFERAGLAAYTPHGREPINPPVVDAGRDERGRQFLVVRVLRGQTLTDWRAAAEVMASAWEVPAVRVERETTATVRVTALPEVPRVAGKVPWRGVDLAPVAEYVQQLPMGEVLGEATGWRVSLAAQHLAIAGQTRMGKSSFIHALLAHLAPHPHVQIAYVDLKAGADARQWAPRCSVVVTQAEDALELLRVTRDEIHARVERSTTPNGWETEGYLSAREPLRVLIIDEVSELFLLPGREAAEAEQILRSIAQQAASHGYLLVLATQRMDAGAVPKAVLSQAATRVAYRTGGRGETEMILGTQQLPEALEPSEFAAQAKGMATTTDPTGGHVRVQTAWMGEPEQTARATAHLRRGWLWDSEAAPSWEWCQDHPLEPWGEPSQEATPAKGLAVLNRAEADPEPVGDTTTDPVPEPPAERARVALGKPDPEPQPQPEPVGESPEVLRLRAEAAEAKAAAAEARAQAAEAEARAQAAEARAQAPEPEPDPAPEPVEVEPEPEPVPDPEPEPVEVEPEPEPRQPRTNAERLAAFNERMAQVKAEKEAAEKAEREKAEAEKAEAEREQAERAARPRFALADDEPAPVAQGFPPPIMDGY